jgi:hypothetical protein
MRSKHSNEIRTELKKYSDILDLRNTNINPYGIGYTFFSSTTPHISLGLYVKPRHYNRETLIELSSKLINFFNNEFFNDNEMIIKYGDMLNVSIYFILKEGKKHNIYYYVEYKQNEWIEKWCEIPFPYR